MGRAWCQPPTDSPTPAQSPTPPPSVDVQLHQLRLFQIEGLGQISAADRQQILQERLNDLLRDEEAPFHISLGEDGPNRVLTCRGRYLVTVTSVDAWAAGVDVPTLAAQWAWQLEKGLNQVYLEDSDEYYKFALWNCGWALLAAAVLHILVRRLCLRWLNTPGLSIRSLLWIAAVTYALHQFPRTRFFSLALQRYALQPLLLLGLVALGWALLSWVAHRGTRHYFLQTERLQSRRRGNSPRWRQRLHMVRDVTQFVISTLMVVLAFIVYFSLLDLNLGAVLAGAGFLGVGLGFAAQDVLKDYTAGVNIMVEDQFGAGDVITVGDFCGVVEHFTLRVTQLRDLGGSLITIPNSRIGMVQNQSNLWSQVDLIIGVALDSDLRRALQVLEETALQLRSEWPERITEPPQILGVEGIGPYQIDLRLLLRTAPQQQFCVRRELLLRIVEAFRQAHIEIPMQSTRMIGGGLGGGAPL